MSKRSVILLFFILILLYPIYSIFRLEQVIGENGESVQAQNSLINYQVSIWISWIGLVCLAVYYKWNQKNNLFFYLTYGFLAFAFIIFGYYTQAVVNIFDLPSRFEDNYTHGVFAAAQNIIISAILTGFLQAAVWWFTRRWHRR